MPENCMYETYAATYDQPAESCDEEALEDSDFCGEHVHVEDGPDPDYARDLAYDMAMEA